MLINDTNASNLANIRGLQSQDPDEEEVKKNQHKWIRIEEEDQEVAPKSVESAPIPQPVVSTKEDLEREAELENFMVKCLIALFGALLIILIAWVISYCSKE